MSDRLTTGRFIVHCVFSDAMDTRAMIKAGGGTVVSTKPMQVTDVAGNRVAGFAVGYDLPMLVERRANPR
jgi:hypothetical protein